jgi:bifunctional ADP-heptose synthase (sugar kinase/adenylyltransferase)
MTPRRLQEIAASYPKLRIALVGDICVDRYFEIDPGLQEISIETNLPVHNVVRVRCQPGGAGTILNNLVALGVGEIYPAAIIGKDGEGYELRRALESVGKRGENEITDENTQNRAVGGRASPRAAVRTAHVQMDWIVESAERHTFTYSKPLVMHKNRAPEELNRLDTKNWTPTPMHLQERVVEAVRRLADQMDAMILLDQVDIPETGVVTQRVLNAVREVAERNPNLLILADSRRSLRGFPAVSFKMNAAEIGLFFNAPGALPVEEIQAKALSLAKQNGKHVFVTMSERGIVGAHGGQVEMVPALPVRGEIDIVGAGDAVTANLTAALTAGASLRETLEIAQLAASVVVHQLGTTGTASVEQMSELLEAKE